MTVSRNSFDEVLSNIIHRIGLNLNEKHQKSVIQFIKFGIVGFSNTLISYLINVGVLLFLNPFQLRWDYIAGNVISFLLSVLWSFYWNNKYVFGMGSMGGWLNKLIKSYLSYGFTGIVLSNILSFLWISVFHISKFIAPLINLIVSVPLNFVIHKLWVYHS